MGIFNSTINHLENTVLYGNKEQILQLSRNTKIKSWIFHHKTGDTLLHLALRNYALMHSGIVEVLEFFINRGVNPNIRNYRNETLLHLAMATWSKEVVDYLLMLQRHGKICVADDQSNSSLLRIFLENLVRRFRNSTDSQVRVEVEKKSADFIEWLLFKGFDCDCIIENGLSALRLAIEHNLQHILPALLRHTRDINFVSEYENETLLHSFLKVNFDWNDRTKERIPPSAFSRRYDIEIVRMMLERGVSVDHEDRHGRTAVHLAIDYAARTETDMSIATMLFDCFTKFQDSCGQSLLFSILQYPYNEDYYEILTTLVANGVDVNTRDIYGQTPLYCAVIHKNSHAISTLKENGADFSVIARHNGNNLLHALLVNTATDFDEMQLREKIFDLLVSEGCDINARNYNGETPLHRAICMNCNIVFIQKLIAHGADVNCRAKLNDSTPLHLAIDYGWENIVKLLLDNGANVNCKSCYYDRPLHLELHHAETNTSILELLLSHNAEVNARDSRGKSAIAKAFFKRRSDIFRLLLAYGGDIGDISVTDKMIHYRDDYASIDLTRHLIKLQVAKLPYSRELKPLSYIQPDDQSSYYHQMCLTEVSQMQSTYIDSQTTLYQWLHMDPDRRYIHSHNEQLRALVNSPTLAHQFPEYSTVILGHYRDTEARRRYLESAKDTLTKLIQFCLPDICLQRILVYLKTEYLFEIAEWADERDK